MNPISRLRLRRSTRRMLALVDAHVALAEQERRNEGLRQNANDVRWRD